MEPLHEPQHAATREKIEKFATIEPARVTFQAHYLRGLLDRRIPESWSGVPDPWGSLPELSSLDGKPAATFSLA